MKMIIKKKNRWKNYVKHTQMLRQSRLNVSFMVKFILFIKKSIRDSNKSDFYSECTEDECEVSPGSDISV